MALITLTDNDLQRTLDSAKPVLILVSDGTGLRGDFSTAFKKIADETPALTIARIDPTHNPQAAARFGYNGKPTLVAWYCGAELVRRSRPWGTDVPLAVELLQKALADNPPAADKSEPELVTVTQKENPMTVVNNKPMNVTDATFQTDVIDYSLEMPVLIDYWAAWCGPCRMVAPVLDKLAGEFAGKVRIAKVDVDANPALSQTFGIQSIPTLMMIKNRTIVFSQPGALTEPVIRDLMNQLIALDVPVPPAKPEAEAQPE